MVSPGRLRARWVAFRTLGSVVHIAGETPLGEPIVVTGSDRLVLRRGTRSFWVAGTCQKCGSEAAGIDLGAHGRVCRGPSRQRAPLPSPRPAQPEPQPHRVPVERPRPAQPEPQPHRVPVERPRPAQPERQQVAELRPEPRSRPAAPLRRPLPEHRRYRRTWGSLSSVKSRRRVSIYADALVVFVIAAFICLVIVFAITTWLGVSTL